MVIDGKNLTITRGDTDNITVTIKENDIQVPLVDGDTVYLTVKKSINDKVIILQKIITAFTEGSAFITINPIDTDDLAFSDYVYDIQLTKVDGTITTLVTPNTFTIGGEVT